MSTAGLLHLSVQVASRRPTFDRAQIRRWVRSALEVAREARSTQLVVRFCDTAEARKLNRQFRSRDYATNVLTFAEQDSDLVSADIVLCVPVLEREARAQDRSVKSHTAHLVIHGTLHALGYDHQSPGMARQMEALEVEALARFSISDPYRETA